MGMRKLGDTIILDFVLHNPATGFVQDADSLPTCEVFDGENDIAILSPTVTKRTGKIGDYRVPIEATVGNGFEVGKSYNVIVSVTVSGIDAKGRIGSFTLDSERNADLQSQLDEVQGQITAIQETQLIDLLNEILKILKITEGRWKIENNELIIYEQDNVTVHKRFRLLDKDGNPTMENIMERHPE